jgi:hypothetical protein
LPQNLKRQSRRRMDLSFLISFSGLLTFRKSTRC